MLSAFDNFPALLIWLPLIGGVVSFLLKGEGRARAWAMLSSILTLAVVGVSLLYTDEKHYLLNLVSYVWLNSLGSSFALMLDGLSRTLCLLTAVTFPLVIAVSSRSRYEQPHAFYGLLLLSQAGLMGVFMAVDALTFYFFWELALIPVYFLASRWGGERRIQRAEDRHRKEAHPRIFAKQQRERNRKQGHMQAGDREQMRDARVPKRGHHLVVDVRRIA